MLGKEATRVTRDRQLAKFDSKSREVYIMVEIVNECDEVNQSSVLVVYYSISTSNLYARADPCVEHGLPHGSASALKYEAVQLFPY